MEIAGLCLPLKPQKERISNKLSDYKRVLKVKNSLLVVHKLEVSPTKRQCSIAFKRHSTGSIGQ